MLTECISYLNVIVFSSTSVAKCSAFNNCFQHYFAAFSVVWTRADESYHVHNNTNQMNIAFPLRFNESTYPVKYSFKCIF